MPPLPGQGTGELGLHLLWAMAMTPESGVMMRFWDCCGLWWDRLWMLVRVLTGGSPPPDTEICQAGQAQSGQALSSPPWGHGGISRVPSSEGSRLQSPPPLHGNMGASAEPPPALHGDMGASAEPTPQRGAAAAPLSFTPDSPP